MLYEEVFALVQDWMTSLDPCMITPTLFSFFRTGIKRVDIMEAYKSFNLCVLFSVGALTLLIRA